MVSFRVFRFAGLLAAAFVGAAPALADVAGSLEYGPPGAGGVAAIPALDSFGLLLLAVLAAAVAWRVLRRGGWRGSTLPVLLAVIVLFGALAGGGWAHWARAAGLFWSVDLDAAAGGIKPLNEGVTVVVNRTATAMEIRRLDAAEHFALGDPADVQPDAQPRCTPGLVLAPGARCHVLLASTSGAAASEAVDDSMGALQSQLEAVAPGTLDPSDRAELDQQVADAAAAQKGGLSCVAVDVLDGMLARLQALRDASTQPVVENLYNRAHTLRAEITAAAGAQARCFDPAVGRGPGIEIAESDDEHLAGSITFGAPRIWTVGAAGDAYTQVEIPGLETRIGPPGFPAIPSVQRLVAVPDGADLVLTFEADGRPLVKVNLYPFQEMPVDQAREPAPDPARFADRPFVKNAAAYAAPGFGPADACSVTPVGSFRDLRLAQLSCSAGAYDPVAQELRLFERIRFDLRFRGGDGRFVASQATSPFEDGVNQTVRDATLNRDWVRSKAELAGSWRVLTPGRPPEWLTRNCIGEEYVIFTHPDFLSAANRLAAWKNEKGIATRVFTVMGGAGAAVGNDYFPLDSAENIARFIDHRFDHCKVRPAYVLLLGDAEFVPTFHSPHADDDYAGTDFPYAVYGPYTFSSILSRPSLVPSYAVGRIPVDTLAEADVVIDKIIRYENEPPVANAQSTFYKRVAIASQFQCCLFEEMGDNQPPDGTAQRSFIETSETVRRTLLQANYAVDRIYTQTTDPEYTGDPTPRRYFNGELLPPDLRASNGFAWDGDTDGIADAWNEGRFLFIHRDHGWPMGWAHPYFHNFYINELLANGELQPVVYSINCASGLFDNETMPGDALKSGTDMTLSRYYNASEYSGHFAELALRSENGAIGVIGDTRDSPTWPNSALLRGLVDATWPQTDPAFGAPVSTRRLGDILNWGKLYLLAQINVAQTAGSVWEDGVRFEDLIWHVIGDPTLEMWTGDPNAVSVPHDFNLRQIPLGSPLDLIVGYEGEGATITVFQDLGDGETLPLGRARVQGGAAELTFVNPRQAGLPLQVSACQPHGRCVRLDG